VVVFQAMREEVEEKFSDGCFVWDDRRPHDCAALLKQFLRYINETKALSNSSIHEIIFSHNSPSLRTSGKTPSNVQMILIKLLIIIQSCRF